MGALGALGAGDLLILVVNGREKFPGTFPRWCAEASGLPGGRERGARTKRLHTRRSALRDRFGWAVALPTGAGRLFGFAARQQCSLGRQNDCLCSTKMTYQIIRIGIFISKTQQPHRVPGARAPRWYSMPEKGWWLPPSCSSSCMPRACYTAPCPLHDETTRLAA